MRIFVSSTYRDLVAHREMVNQVLARMKLEFAAMEYFGSRGDEALPICKQEIGECDLFVGIYAWRYGWQPDETGPSITEAEFNEARARGKTCLCYVVDDDHPWRPSMIDPPDSDAGRSLAVFKARIARLVRSTFTTPENLASQVAADLGREVSRLGVEAAPTRPMPDRLWAGYCLRLASELAKDTESTVNYLPLHIEDPRGLRSDLGQRFFAWLEELHEPMLAILGDFGSGKTTFCRHLCQELAAAWEPDSDSFLPVLIPLRAYRSSATLSDMMAAELRRLGGSINRLTDIMRLLIILDGLDEQAERFSDQETSRLLFEAHEAMPAESKIVLTCRTHFFRDDVAESRLLAKPNRFATGLLPRGVSAIPTLYLAPLNAEQKQEYLRRTQGDSWREAAATIERVYDLQDLANRPILLSLITNLLPELRAEDGGVGQARLYEIATESWIVRESWRGLDAEEVARFLEDVAFAGLMNRQEAIHYRDLSTSVRQHFDTKILSAVDLEAWDGIVRTSLFMNRDADGYYAFMHKSFQEYFAARALIRMICSRSFPQFPEHANNRISEEMRNLVGQLMPRESCNEFYYLLGEHVSLEATRIAAALINQLHPSIDFGPDDERIPRICLTYREHHYNFIAEACFYVFRTTRSRYALPTLFEYLYEHPDFLDVPDNLKTIAVIADRREIATLSRLRDRITADVEALFSLDPQEFDEYLRHNPKPRFGDDNDESIMTAIENARTLFRKRRLREVRLSDFLDKGWRITGSEVEAVITLIEAGAAASDTAPI
jgi:hypothetical protein